LHRLSHSGRFGCGSLQNEVSGGYCARVRLSSITCRQSQKPGSGSDASVCNAS
jgi:hypothetical protein